MLFPFLSCFWKDFFNIRHRESYEIKMDARQFKKTKKNPELTKCILSQLIKLCLQWKKER